VEILGRPVKSKNEKLLAGFFFTGFCCGSCDRKMADLAYSRPLRIQDFDEWLNRKLLAELQPFDVGLKSCVH
jgi:hypothetical protein